MAFNNNISDISEEFPNPTLIEDGRSLERRFSTKIIVKGVKVLGNNNTALNSWVQKLEKQIDETNDDYDFEAYPFQIRVVAGSDVNELEALYMSNEPQKFEVNFFLNGDDNGKSFVKFGSEFRTRFLKLKDFGSGKNPIKINGYNDLNFLKALKDGCFTDTNSTSLFTRLVHLSQLVSIVMSPVYDLVNNLKGLNILSMAETYFESIITELVVQVESTINEANDDPENPMNQILFFNQAESFLEDFKKQYFDTYFGNLILSDTNLEYLNDCLQYYFKDNLFMKYWDAKNKFDEALINSLTNTDNLDATVIGFIEDFKKNKEQLTDMALGGAIMGSACFTIGTIYQIIYDIVNTIVQLVKYSLAFLQYLGGEVLEALQSVEEEDNSHPYDVNIISSFFPSFDVNKFLSEDLKPLVYGLRDLVLNILDNFIINASEYGTMAGNFMHHIAQKSISGVLKLIFKPYDQNASFLDRLWWVVTSYFNIGTILGPIIVDLILLICSGGTLGVVSATAKFGKIAKVDKLFRFAKESAEGLQNLKLFTTLDKMIPAKLRALISKLLDDLWAAIGSAWDAVKSIIERGKSYITIAYNELKNTDGLPSLDSILKTIDNFYDGASLINFVISLYLILFGGEINEEGNLVIAE